jgi:3-deoxy-D-manno-octulosonic-acid transferase
VVGPHMENFPGVIDDFRAAGAIVQVPDAAALPSALARLLDDAAARESLGRRAAALVQKKAGSIARTLEALAPLVHPAG